MPDQEAVSRESQPGPRWPAYRRVRELETLYSGASALRPVGTAPRVAVVGAGLAGLAAAHLLARGGCKPLVFEASARLGGRIRTDREELAPNMVSELGGEFVDSAHADMIALARYFGCTPIDTGLRSEANLHTAFRYGGRIYTDQQESEAFAPFAARIRADAARLSARVTRARHSATDERFDKMSIDEYLDHIGMSGWLRARISGGYAALNGLDGAEQSSINLLDQIGTDPATGMELNAKSDERWKVAEGLDRLIEGLAGGLPVPPQREHCLARIRRTGDAVTLDFTTPGGTASVVADAVVLALPFTLLRQVDTAGVFSPHKQYAIDHLAYGTNSKVLVGTRRPVWREQGFAGELYTDGLAQSGWDSSRLRGGGQNVYTFFLGGRRGLECGEGSLQHTARQLAGEAEKSWPGFSAALNGRMARVHWPSEPWALASYSTYGVGQRTGLAGEEQRPEGGIYFAGEHCSASWQGYMQGAAATGRTAATQILRQWAG